MLTPLFRGLGANVVALGFASFFTDLASETVFALMPAFLIGTLGATPAFLGLIEGLADSLSAILRVVSGWFADRLQRRKFLVFLGYGLSGVVRPVYALATAAWHVLGVRLVDRVGKGLRIAARDALIAASCAPEVRGKAFGLQKAMDHLGAAIGPALGTLLLASGVPIRTVFWLSAIPAALVLVVIGGFVKDVPNPPPTAVAGRVGRGFRPFLGVLALFTLANSSDAFILLRATSCGVPVEAVPLLWTGINLVRVLLSLPGGILSDRMDRRRTIAAGWAVYAGVYAGLAFTDSLAPFLILVGVYGVYHALTESALKAFVADLVPADARGRAYGLYHFAIGLGSLPASWGFGVIWKRFGPGAAFATGASLALAAAVALLLLVRGSRKQGLPECRRQP